MMCFNIKEAFYVKQGYKDMPLSLWKTERKVNTHTCTQTDSFQRSETETDLRVTDVGGTWTTNKVQNEGSVLSAYQEKNTKKRENNPRDQSKNEAVRGRAKNQKVKRVSKKNVNPLQTKAFAIFRKIHRTIQYK